MSAPLNRGLSVGPPAQDRAASRRPITVNLGNWSLPQVGDGFVTPSLPGAVGQGNYPTPPSREWAVYKNAASSNHAFQVLLVSVETFTTLDNSVGCPLALVIRIAFSQCKPILRQNKHIPAPRRL